MSVPLERWNALEHMCPDCQLFSFCGKLVMERLVF